MMYSYKYTVYVVFRNFRLSLRLNNINDKFKDSLAHDTAQADVLDSFMCPTDFTRSSGSVKYTGD